ncbi:hypothetical protein BSU04_14000 [Caballeronia sordidicola]|uniref:Uncharacterized protein n=1 Tax=Caballeronia sordidicola TaxID=196367 RepID=A0A226X3H6_CABSO|nr:hypothetical protein BSU04_14000 [Caballeronia sordidicola]
MVISAVSLSDVSEIAIVPDRECNTPTLMGPVSAACALEMGNCPAIASAPDIEPNFRRLRRFIVFPLADMFVGGECLIDFSYIADGESVIRTLQGVCQ